MRTRSSRHTKKLGVAALVSFALVAAACGGSDDDSGSDSTDAAESTDAPEETDSGDTETTDAPVVSEGQIEEDVIEEPEEEAVQGGTLRYGLEADVDGINPTSSALSSPGLMMSNAVFDNLSAYASDGTPIPYLAESIEPVDGDFSVWQVKLRPDILFHDGTPLNAEAVQVNFEAQRADPLVGLAVAPYFPAEGATEIIDDLTIQYNLLEPNASFAGTMEGQLGYVASPTWLAAALDDPTLNQAPVGTGPFKFDSRSPDSVTRFVRNDDWWGGDVYLDAVEFVPVTDPDTRNDLLFNGELNALQTSNPASVGDLQGDGDVQNVIDETGEEGFVMINSDVAPFDDIRVRQALTFATPLETYRSLIGLGIARAADQMFIPESIYFNPDVVQEGDMPDEAAALVAEYCAERGAETNPVTGDPTCSDGKVNMELQWSGPSVIQTRIAEILDEGWSASFNVTFDELAQDDHIQQTALGQYNVNTWRQFGAVDPSNDKVWLMCRNIGGISLNWPKFCDEARDTLINDAQATLDPDVRIPLYQDLSQNLNDAYTYIFTLHTIWDNAFDDTVRGMCDRTAPDSETVLRCATNGRTWFDSVWIAG
jgi:peptide/nickel transport system substrate-binding protein